MKAITIRAPYAQLIMLGLKHYETRKTKVLHKVVGQRIAIHCGRDVREFDDIRDGLFSVPKRQTTLQIEKALQELTPRRTLNDFSYYYDMAGCVIATAVVADEIKMWGRFIDKRSELERACGYWYEGYYAYELTDVQPLPTPVPARGNVTLWDWTPEGVSV